MHILGSSHEISLQVYQKITFLVTNMYTNIHSYQHKITQPTRIHLVHNCNIWTFDTVTVWSLLNILANWWVHHKIAFQNYPFHTLTSSVSTVFQNSWHILGIILHICCPTSQKLYCLHCLVEILQWKPIDVPLLYDWNNLIRVTLESSLMLLNTSCLQSFPYSEIILLL